MTRRFTLSLFILTGLFAFVTFLAGSPACAEQNPSSALSETIQEKEAGAKKDMATTPPPLDRRWIIKMKDERGKKLPPTKKPAPIVWTDDAQKTRCEELAARLHEGYSKARYYSVGGDACNTARHAEIFLDLVQECRSGCPKGYLESKGYNRQMVRNMGMLHELGEKKCLQAVSGPDAAVAEKHEPLPSNKQPTKSKGVRSR